MFPTKKYLIVPNTVHVPLGKDVGVSVQVYKFKASQNSEPSDVTNNVLLNQIEAMFYVGEDKAWEIYSHLAEIDYINTVKHKITGADRDFKAKIKSVSLIFVLFDFDLCYIVLIALRSFHLIGIDSWKVKSSCRYNYRILIS